eukprot:m.248921 g.248921  ORF g.248921 m.248921 type:complete len:182 (-) comp19081_c0_seq4:23-568(-)
MSVHKSRNAAGLVCWGQRRGSKAPDPYLQPHQLAQAGVREVAEETGVVLSESATTPIMLFESAHPALLDHGHPSRHHLIAYLKVQLQVPHDNVKLRLQPSEVGAAAWLSEDDVGFVLNPPTQKPESRMVPGVVLEETLHQKTQIDICPLAYGDIKFQRGDPVAERLTTGTRAALEALLEKL